MSDKIQITHQQKLIFGGMFALFGVIFILAGYEDPTRGESTAYKVIGFITIALTPFYYVLLYKMRSKRLDERSRQLLYDFLSKNEYKCTVVEFAVHSGIDPEKARTILDHVAAKSGVNPEVNENGIVVYKFK